jgi:hypothetical protein
LSSLEGCHISTPNAASPIPGEGEPEQDEIEDEADSKRSVDPEDLKPLWVCPKCKIAFTADLSHYETAVTVRPPRICAECGSPLIPEAQALDDVAFLNSIPDAMPSRRRKSGRRRR